MAGISGFSYLHSRKKQDLFHSIPVRREILFLVQQASGFLLWLAPFLGAWILTLLAAAVKGILTGAVWAAAFQGLGLAVLVFLLPYETVILAMLLTGKLLTAVLGMGVFFLYGRFSYCTGGELSALSFRLIRRRAPSGGMSSPGLPPWRQCSGFWRTEGASGGSLFLQQLHCFFSFLA